jgi:hypothetical protein
MTLQDIMREVQQLSDEERKQLLTMLIDSLGESQKVYDLIDFAGVGVHLADETDPQEHINRLRSEWDHRP